MKKSIYFIFLIFIGFESLAQITTDIIYSKVDSKVINFKNSYGAREGFSSYDVGIGIGYKFPKYKMSTGVNILSSQRYFRDKNNVGVINFSTFNPYFEQEISGEHSNNTLIMSIGPIFSFPDGHLNKVEYNYWNLGINASTGINIFVSKIYSVVICTLFKVDITSIEGENSKDIKTFTDVAFNMKVRMNFDFQSFKRKKRKKRK